MVKVPLVEMNMQRKMVKAPLIVFFKIGSNGTKCEIHVQKKQAATEENKEEKRRELFSIFH